MYTIDHLYCLFPFQEGTIGEHLVLKPIPSVYRRHVQSTPDDEMFLDQEIREDEISKQGFPLKSKFVAHHKHVVYRRNPETDRNAGDYGLCRPISHNTLDQN